MKRMSNSDIIRHMGQRLIPLNIAEECYGRKQYLYGLHRRHGKLLRKVGGKTFLDTARFYDISVDLWAI